MPDAEPPVVVRASMWGEVVVTALFGVTAVTLAVTGANGGEGVAALIASTVIALVGIATLVVRPRLEVTRTTLTEVRLLSRRTFDLRHCSRFRALMRKGRVNWWVVVFDYHDPVTDPHPRPRRVKARRWAPNASVEAHGRDAEALAALLNEARDHARRT